MLRIITKTLDRSLTLNLNYCALKNARLETCFKDQMQQRLLVYSALLRNAESVLSEPSITEYIVPYKTEFEKPDNAKKISKYLRTEFGLSIIEVKKIMNDEVVLKNYRKKCVLKTLEILSSEGIKKENFVEYPWLITLDGIRLQEKIDLLKHINGFRDINDFVPFLRMQIPRLRKLVAFLNVDANIEHGNRVYYISHKLNVLPCIVTKYLAKRLFVLEMPLVMFKTNLQNMIKYNVEPINILKDLWGFRYATHAVELRLRRASQAKKDKIMPWMVRCPETTLEKSLQLSLDELKILGDKTTVAEYVGERLGFSAEEAQTIMDKHPQVNTVRVTKIKEVLDYLLDEAKFTRHEVAQVPRILCHSLETTKQRIEELKENNCRPSSLIIVCRSRREYEKFLKQWQQTYKQNRTFERGKKDD